MCPYFEGLAAAPQKHVKRKINHNWQSEDKLIYAQASKLHKTQISFCSFYLLIKKQMLRLKISRLVLNKIKELCTLTSDLSSILLSSENKGSWALMRMKKEAF